MTPKERCEESKFDAFQAFIIQWMPEGFSIYTSVDSARELDLDGWTTGSICNNMQSASTRNTEDVKRALKRGIAITPKAALQLL